MPTKTSKSGTDTTKTTRSTKTTASAETTKSSPRKSASNGKASVGSKSNTGYLSSNDMEHFRDLLLQERARLEEEREQIRSRSGSVDGALPEEGEGGDEDTADLASAMMDKEMDLSVEDEIEDLLGQVAHALRKIEDGTYGICDMSGERISKGRLELIPWAALTVECQAIAEGQ